MAEKQRLISGKRYRFTYQTPGLHRIPRTMVADYIDTYSDDRSRRYILSGRPTFGTTELDVTDVIKFERVPMSEPTAPPTTLKP